MPTPFASGSLLASPSTRLDRAVLIPWALLLAVGWSGLLLWLPVSQRPVLLGMGWLGCWGAVLASCSPLLRPGGTRSASWVRVHYGWENARAVLDQLPEEGEHAHIMRLARRHTDHRSGDRAA
jgi:hypothetical protein